VFIAAKKIEETIKYAGVSVKIQPYRRDRNLTHEIHEDQRILKMGI
jgi:hypothetical protein